MIDSGAINSLQIGGLEGTLARGQKLGMSRVAVYNDLERATNSYLASYSKRAGSSSGRTRQSLFDDITECVSLGGPND